MARLALLLSSLLLLVLVTIACGGDEDGGDDAPQPTATVYIDDGDCAGTPNDDATGNCTLREAIDRVNAGDADIISFHPPVAAIRAEAESLCPGALGPCVTAYVAQADSSNPAVFCVSDSGTWYFSTPRATPDPAAGEEGNEARAVGDECRLPGHVAVAVVGGDN